MFIVTLIKYLDNFYDLIKSFSKFNKVHNLKAWHITTYAQQTHNGFRGYVQTLNDVILPWHFNTK